MNRRKAQISAVAAALLAAWPAGGASRISGDAGQGASVLQIGPFVRPADHGDASLAVQRAIDALCAAGGGELELAARHYRIASPIVQKCALLVLGKGWAENAGAQQVAGAAGTWLDIEKPGFVPWTVTGVAAAGSQFRDFAVDEPGQRPPEPAQFSGRILGNTLLAPAGAALAPGEQLFGAGFGNGLRIGKAAGAGRFALSSPVADTAQEPMQAMAAWTPAPYAYVFVDRGIGGSVTFRNIFMDGVTDGIESLDSGRLRIDGLFGQFFDNALRVDQSFDADRIDNLHDWPYWSQALGVIAYQQAQASGIILARADGPFLNNLFFFAQQSGLKFAAAPSGAATGVEAGNLSCDGVRYCIDVRATGATAQFANVQQFGQAGIGSGTVLPGAAAIMIEGSGRFQVSNLEAGALDKYLVDDTNTATCTTLAVGAITARFNLSSQRNVALLGGVPCSAVERDRLEVATRPVIQLRSAAQAVTPAAGAGAVVEEDAITEFPGH